MKITKTEIVTEAYKLTLTKGQLVELILAAGDSDKASVSTYDVLTDVAKEAGIDYED